MDNAMRERKTIEYIEAGYAPDGRRAMRIDFEDGECAYCYVDSDSEAEEMRGLIGRIVEVEMEDEISEPEWVTVH